MGTDPNGFNNIVGWGPSTAMLDTANSYALLGSLDTISYTLPSVIEGVGVSFQSLRPTSTTTGTGTSITYTNAGLYAGWANRLSGADKSTAYAVSYDFGAAKVAYSSIDSTIGGAKTTDSTYTISAPVTSAASVGFSSGTYNLDGTKTNNSQLGAYYNLSKRTQAYVIYGKASAASSTTTTAVGVNHAF